MKTLILMMTLLFASSTGFAQNNPIDFEDGGIGADFTWEVFENTDNPPVAIIDNPDATGANTSSKVAQFTARADGASFAGTITRGTDTYLLDETNRTIKIMVWKSVISDVGIKLETASGWSFGEIKVANTVTDQWEELTFDFSDVPNPPEGEPYNGITVFPDFQERSQENVIFFDNIAFSEQAGSGGTEGNLLTNGDFESGNDGSWVGNAFNIVTEGGNSFNFANVEVAGNAFDVNLSQVVDLIPGESYTLTFDASTGAGNTRSMVVGIGLNQAPFFADVETVTLTEATQTFTIDLAATDDGTGTDFGTEQSRVIFDMGADVGVVVIDNVSLELTGDTGGGVVDGPLNPIDFEDGGIGADFTWEVFENTDNPPVAIIDNPDPNGANTSAKVAQFTARSDGAPFAGTITRGTGTFFLDDTNRTIKIMVWKSVISNVGIKLETASGFAFPEILEANTVTNQWEELTFDFSEVENPPGGEPYNGITIFPDFQDRSQENVIFFDNITFNETQLVTSVEELDNLPNQFVLNQNYPNPFNPTTNITFTIPQSSDVKLEVFNTVGQRVITLVNGVRNAGTHTITFDASNLASGVYLYRLTSGNNVQINKMLLLK